MHIKLSTDIIIITTSHKGTVVFEYIVEGQLSKLFYKIILIFNNTIKLASSVLHLLIYLSKQIHKFKQFK